jgi:exodeoxyribonuclease X
MRIQDTRFVILDTETTGLSPVEDKVVDISLVEVSRNGISPLYDTLINPERDIPATASAVHHITSEDVADKPLFAEVWPTVMEYLADAVVVAHNAAFDRSMIPDTGRPWICSYRLARHLWPDAPGHSNQVLRYWLNLKVDAKAAHSAAGDTLVTAHVFWQELIHYRKQVARSSSIEELIEFAASPIPVAAMPFGKHKGTPMAEIPLSYFQWALENLNELDPDLKIAMEQQAAARQGS